jgi:hypothetical protein
MKLLGKIVLGTLAGLLLISGIAVLSPRAVSAVVATIIRDQDNPARHPFTTRCSGQSITSNSRQAACTTPAIPAGEEVVIETISIVATADPGNHAFGFSVETAAAGFQTFYGMNTLFDNGTRQPTGALYAGVQSLRLYADPGSTIFVLGVSNGANPSQGVTIQCSISGYYVTLP